MLFENEYKPPPLPDYRKMRKFDDDDAAFIYAVKALEPLMAFESQQHFMTILENPMTLAQQIAAWRARRKAYQWWTYG